MRTVREALPPVVAQPHRRPLVGLSATRKFWALLKGAALAWNEDSVPRYSASLAYYTFFSLAPLLIIFIAMSGIFFGRDAAEGRIMAQLEAFVGTPTARAIQAVIRGAWKPGTDFFAMGVGIVALLAGATGVLNELKSALNAIWQVKSPNGMKFFVLSQTKLLGFVLGMSFLLLVSLLFSAAVTALGTSFSGLLPLPEWLLHLLNVLFDWMITVCMFATIFKWLPDLRVAWKDVWIGAAFTSVLFLGGKFFLGLYLGKSGLSSVYGAAGSLILILLWVYYSAIIFYFGAEFIKVVAKSRRITVPEKSSPPVKIRKTPSKYRK